MFPANRENLAIAVRSIKSADETTRHSTTNIQTATDNLNKTIGQLQKSAGLVDEQTSRLSQTLDKPVSTLQTSVEALHTASNTLNGTTGKLGNQVTSLDGQVNSLRSHIETFQTKANEVGETSAEFLTTVTNLKQDTIEFAKNRSELASEVKDVHGLIQQVKTQLDTKTGAFAQTLKSSSKS